MTQEQYNRAVSINKRIGELQKVKNEIEGISHRLSYAKKRECDWTLMPQWLMNYIGSILDKHDRMILDEIDAEIERLNKEIETI